MIIEYDTIEAFLCFQNLISIPVWLQCLQAGGRGPAGVPARQLVGVAGSRGSGVVWAVTPALDRALNSDLAIQETAQNVRCKMLEMCSSRALKGRKTRSPMK